jgi:abortive infection bacteriophage resistance protein
MKYSKVPLSLSDQITRLKQRGLKFIDEKKAVHYLSNISYYRLRAYTYPFQDNSTANHPFIKDVSFEDIIDIYVFDRRLRLLVLNAIEKIEVSLRTKIIYEYALVYGSHWFMDASLYHNTIFYQENHKTLQKEINRSTETFIKHYKQSYTTPKLPPSWMSLEVVSMGLLGKLFSNLKRGELKTKLTKEFGLKKSEQLSSWIHAFVNLRNICAHHSRLWNRRFTIVPQIPYNTTNQFITNTKIYDNKLYAQLCCMNYITRIISPDSSFVSDLKNLLTSCDLVNCKDMGFPDNWRNESLWK